GQDVFAWKKDWADAFCALIDAGGDVSLGHASEIRCPLLLMLGENDTLNPVRAGQRFIDAVTSRKRFEVFSNTGHAIHTEQPANFLDVVRDFLSDVQKST